VVERGKSTTNSVNRMSMEGILEGVLISGLGGYGRNMPRGDYGRNQRADVHLNPGSGVTLTLTRGLGSLEVDTREGWKSGMARWIIERWILG
jgi:hypothetical protein